MLQQIAQLPRVKALYDAHGRCLPGRAQQAHGSLGGSEYPILMFLASLDPVRDEIEADHAAPLPATEGVAVLFPTLSQALSQRLHQSGACLGCGLHFQDADMEEDSPDMAARGLFCFEHLTENWISGPYYRRRRQRRSHPRRLGFGRLIPLRATEQKSPCWPSRSLTVAAPFGPVISANEKMGSLYWLERAWRFGERRGTKKEEFVSCGSRPRAWHNKCTMSCW